MARVLLTEDEERMATLVADALRDDGHEVEVTHDGAAALDRARAGDFEVLVLDVMLPDIDGFTVCRELRKSGVRTAVLMLTARDAIEDRVQGLDVGADDYLVKPFAVAELRARVRALVRRPAGLRGAELRVADLALDPLKREVKRAGRRLELTTREYGFLEFLMRHAGETLTRAEILDGVWGDGAEPYGNVVDLYIHYLRTKTEAGGPRLIHTVRGMGYVLREPDQA
ncbi:MAG: response regulator transcription factor [Dehalococcoidia bacterium]|nr:response regulator transcription factor [Dehalococcoidia bacterium]